MEERYEEGNETGFSTAANFLMRETFWSIMYAEDATLLTISVEEDSKKKETGEERIKDQCQTILGNEI